MRPGRLVWIGVRPARHAPVVIRKQVTLIAESGITDDRYKTSRSGGRQVTLIAAEDLAAVAAFLGRDVVVPEVVRRNLVTSGVNLVALKDQRFRIGPVLLEGSGDCAPCSRMEQALGEGGYNAMRGHGGITARIIDGGEVKVGDAVERAET